MISTTNEFKLTDKEVNEAPIDKFVASSTLQYKINTKKEKIVLLDRKDMWRYFNLIPLQNSGNIVTLGEGRTELVRIPELEKFLNGAKLYCKNECVNPTGTFKDREASYVISKAKELGLKKIVFHSTGNTGRAYTVYASKCGIESFFFLPLSCMDKCDSSMIAENIHIIAVDGHFNQVSKIAKAFAEKNQITTIAPFHDKLEGKATIAYEQFEELPEATIFVQTIAGGYGILGFLLGHNRLKNLEISSSDYQIPRIIAFQAWDNCTIAKGIEIGKENLSESDLILPYSPFEKTLQSTNPLSTFSQVKECLENTDGLIIIASQEDINNTKDSFESAMKLHNINLSFDNEKSPYISFSGLVKLSKEGKISARDIIYMVVTGKGRKFSALSKPEAIVKPTNSDYTVESSSEYLRRFL